MDRTKYQGKAKKYLDKLCNSAPHRCVGSHGNQLATQMFAAEMIKYGYSVEEQSFKCIDWVAGEILLKAGRIQFEAFISPYSLGCDICAPLVSATTVDELEKINTTGKILLLVGEITKEQLMPKKFIFYNPEHHKRIVSLLEQKKPLAILAATTCDPDLAGGISPFPLIEDGDFDIPSAYMTADEGARLLEYIGQRISLKIDAKRIPSHGMNVIGRKGKESNGRIVVCAHIDGKQGTPAAIDNAGSVVVLLLLAEILQIAHLTHCLEIVALNGEDYYAASGEMLYLSQNQGKFDQIMLAINLDGVGYIHGRTAYSLYGCPPEVEQVVYSYFTSQPGFIQGEPWYQSDHGMFINQQRPAMAITSEHFMELCTNITHTVKDQPDIVDTDKLVDTSTVLSELIKKIDTVVILE